MRSAIYYPLSSISAPWALRLEAATTVRAQKNREAREDFPVGMPRLAEGYFFLGTLMTGLISEPQMVPSPLSNKVLLPVMATFLLSWRICRALTLEST